MKDARGHGSNKTNGISVINPNGGNIAKALAQRNSQFGAQFGAAPTTVGDRGSGGPGFGKNTVTSGGHGGDWGDDFAAKTLSSSSPKSAPVPVHDSMHDYGPSKGTGPTMRPTNPAPDSPAGRLAARRAASLERLPS